MLIFLFYLYFLYKPSNLNPNRWCSAAQISVRFEVSVYFDVVDVFISQYQYVVMYLMYMYTHIHNAYMYTNTNTHTQRHTHTLSYQDYRETRKSHTRRLRDH
jgi:hypothetical protein